MSDPMRVLVVDDDFMVARLHKDFVGRIPGFEVVGEARTGAEALEAARRLLPDIVLLDVYLPDLSGLEVLERLRTGGLPPIDVVMITAARDAATVSRALQFGAVSYLIKPFGFPDLADRLGRVAAARRRLTRDPDGRLAQEEVDRVFGGAPVAANVLPKGLSGPTMELVTTRLREATAALSAAEVGELAGISRVSARRYLEHLVGAGRAEVGLRYGAAGRPEREYRLLR